MRIAAEGDVRRVDLDVLRRLVPALWTEWADLEFTSGGWLRDPDTGQPLGILQLVAGRHRVPGARYIVVKDKEQLDFVLTFDSGRIVRGTLASPWWSADLEIGDRISAAGRADVGAALRANDVPGSLIPLIGGRAATGSVLIEPTSLERGGDLIRGDFTAQRWAGELLGGVKTKRTEWHGHLTVRVKGRGLIGRAALVGFRSQVRRGIREGLQEFFDETAKLQSELGELEDQIRAAGGERAFVHTYLWPGVRELALPGGAAAYGGSVTTQATGAGAGAASTRLRRGPLGVRRLERPAQLSLPAQAEQHLINHGSMTKTGQLIVRIHRRGLKVHWPSDGRFDNPPVFLGVVERQASAMTITGTIRETRTARAWPLAWGFATVLMVLVAGIGIYGVASGSTDAYPPLLIGLIGAPMFALFWRGARRDRRPSFTRQSDELEDGLRRWFTTGDGQRSFTL